MKNIKFPNKKKISFSVALLAQMSAAEENATKAFL